MHKKRDAADHYDKHQQSTLAYDYGVLRPAPPGNWKGPYTADRAAFVQAFYDYARANPNGRPQLWGEWRTADAQGVRERSESFKSDAEQIHVLNRSSDSVQNGEL